VTGDECYFYHRHIGKNKSAQRCVGKGVNPKKIVRSQKNEP